VLTPPRWALAAALALGTLGSAQAQPIVRSADLYIGMIGSATNNAVQLVAHAGDVLKVNYETDFNDGYGATCWESVAWVSHTGARVSAAMAGMNEWLEPVQDRGLTINNLTVQNVDLDMGNVQLHFKPPTASPNASIALTLNNGSLGGGLRMPLLWSPSPFQFNVTGDSQIGGWQGALRSVTTLDVASGATLRIKDSGSVAPGAGLNDKLYFSELNNTAVISGGSLIIDNSAVVFGQDPHDMNANQSTMTFLNNATLQLMGNNSTPKLETDRIVLQNSTLNLADNTALKARRLLELDNSTATIGDGAVVDAFEVIAKGNSTATLTHHAGGGLYSQGIVTSFLTVNDGATFTLAGTGDMGVTAAVYFPSSGFGAIRVTQDAALSLQNATSSLIINSHGSLTTERTATTRAVVGLIGSSMVLHPTGTFVNNGSFWMDEDSDLNVVGHATIGGTGNIDMDGRLHFAVGAPGEKGKSSLTTDNNLAFMMSALVTMSLDPLGLTSDQIICGGALYFSPTANLSLQLVNDTALAEGIKFALFDYRGTQSPLGNNNHFFGYANGTVFNLGANTYEINYRDGDYLPGSTSFITLTTVPEPSAAAILFGGALLLGLARRNGRRS
jgi:hypothetical protein